MAWSYFWNSLPSSLCSEYLSEDSEEPVPAPHLSWSQTQHLCFHNDLHPVLLHEQPAAERKLISSSCRKGRDLKSWDSGSEHRGSKVDLVSKWHGSDLDPGRNVIDDANSLGVWVSGEAVGNYVVLHLPRRLRACFLTVDGLACRALKTAILLWRKTNISNIPQYFKKPNNTNWKEKSSFLSCGVFYTDVALKFNFYSILDYSVFLDQ